MAYHLYRFGASQQLPQKDPQDDVAGGDVPSDGYDVAAGTHYAYGDGVIPLRRHTINHRGIYSTNLQTSIDAMMGLLGVRDQLWRTVELDSSIQWKYARLLSCRWRRDVAQRDHAVVNLSFEAEGNWKAETQSDDFRSSTGSLAASNLGDAYIPDAIFKFTASSTTTHTFRVEIAGTGVDWQWSGTVNSGEIVLIDGGALAVTNNGADAYANFTLNAGHSAPRWLWLAPGSNTVTVTLSAGAGTLQILWYDQWI